MPRQLDALPPRSSIVSFVVVASREHPQPARPTAAKSRRSTGRSLLEVIEDRDNTRSTLVASQIPVDKWHDYLGDPTVADAIADRLLHSAHRLALSGPSRRKDRKKAPTKQD